MYLTFFSHFINYVECLAIEKGKYFTKTVVLETTNII